MLEGAVKRSSGRVISSRNISRSSSGDGTQNLTIGTSRRRRSRKSNSATGRWHASESLRRAWCRLSRFAWGRGASAGASQKTCSQRCIWARHWVYSGAYASRARAMRKRRAPVTFRRAPRLRRKASASQPFVAAAAAPTRPILNSSITRLSFMDSISRGATFFTAADERSRPSNRFRMPPFIAPDSVSIRNLPETPVVNYCTKVVFLLVLIKFLLARILHQRRKMYQCQPGPAALYNSYSPSRQSPPCPVLFQNRQ